MHRHNGLSARTKVQVSFGIRILRALTISLIASNDNTRNV